MSEAFIGEIRMFAGNFAPRGWAFCDGQLLSVSQNSALFSLLGTDYGGDGRTTFGLPELRGRIPVHAGSGSGPGLSARTLGSKSGSENVTLTVNTLTSHIHGWNATTNSAMSNDPANRLAAATPGSYYSDSANLTGLNASAVTSAGGAASHGNLMPFLCVNFIIALTGVFPSRS
jgi:microcystin-dependent protein